MTLQEHLEANARRVERLIARIDKVSQRSGLFSAIELAALTTALRNLTKE